MKTHIEHIEDLVFDGNSGLKKSVTMLKNICQSPENLSVKYDGMPAVIFGRDSSGNFILTDKVGFNAKKYDGKPTSEEGLVSMILARNSKFGNKEEYAAKMAYVRRLLETVVPKDFRGYLWGDLLWVKMPNPNEDFVFKPNVVTYVVRKHTEEMRQIFQKPVGIAIHYYLESPQHSPVVCDEYEFFNNSRVYLFSSKVDVEYNCDQRLLSSLDSLALNRDYDFVVKSPAIPSILRRYVNYLIRTNNYDRISEIFKTWVISANIPEKDKSQIIKTYDENQLYFDYMFDLHKFITKAKLYLLRQLNQIPRKFDSYVGEKRTGEGFVYNDLLQPLKLVDRQVFSHANFAKNK